MAVYEPRAIEGRRNEMIPLGQGLDLTTTPTQRAPGSLSEAINVEIVVGVLLMRTGQLHMGTNEFNHISNDVFFLYGSDVADYALTGSITAYEKVSWWDDANYIGTDKAPNGTGYWWTKNVASAPTNYQDPIAITHAEGQAPTGQLLFVGEDSGAQVLVTDLGVALQGFRYIDEYTSVITDAWKTVFIDMTWRNVSSQVWDNFRPRPLGTGATSHVFQHNDNVYAVRNFRVSRFVDGVEEPSIGDKIQFDGTNYDPTFYVARSELVTGSWDGGDAEGWLYLYPQSDSTLDFVVMSGSRESNIPINNLTTANSLGTTPTSAPFTAVDEMYHGLLWKLDTDSRVNTGWKYVDMGY